MNLEDDYGDESFRVMHIPNLGPEVAQRGVITPLVVILARHCDLCGGALTGRQRRFCSGSHRSAWWDQQHPRVNAPLPPDGPREGTLLECVLGFLVLHSGERFTVHEVAAAVRAFPHSVSARLSELRKRGHDIRTDARNGDSSRAHRFWMEAAHD